MASETFDRLASAFDIPKRLPKGKRQFALGRKAPGTMNKTEARYESDVLKPALYGGLIGWYAYEAITLKLAKATHFRPDFAVVAEDGVLELVDVKGSKFMIEEDAKAKIKIAAALFPFRFVLAWPVKGTGWHREEIDA